MAVSISSSIIACLKIFNEFIEEIQDPDKDEAEGMQVQTWQDELGRLRIWAANTGAHQTGQSSLDFRLRYSSHIRQQIIKLLDELPQRLQNVRAVTAEDEDEDVESLGGSSSEDEESQTEIQQIRNGVATIINCLFQMSILVCKPAQHDLLVGSRKADVAAFEPFDYRHVLDKFPKADKRLVSRLGHAITRRRQYLKNRKRHAIKLKQGIDDVTYISQGDEGTALSQTITTDLPNWHIDFDDKLSESGVQQTSYAPTLMNGGKPFECPYCCYLIIVRSTRSWTRHVFNDLQPYVCTEIICTTPDKLYATRHEWLHHLKTSHRREESSRSVAGDQLESHSCALCGGFLGTQKGRYRHLARHLEELALFVLPRTYDESDEGDYNYDSHWFYRLTSYDGSVDTPSVSDLSDGNRIVGPKNFHLFSKGWSKYPVDKSSDSGTDPNEGYVRIEHGGIEELPRGRGTTRMARSLVNWQTNVELGYPVRDKNDNFGIFNPLAKESNEEIPIPIKDRRIGGGKNYLVETDYSKVDSTRIAGGYAMHRWLAESPREQQWNADGSGTNSIAADKKQKMNKTILEP